MYYDKLSIIFIFLAFDLKKSVLQINIEDIVSKGFTVGMPIHVQLFRIIHFFCNPCILVRIGGIIHGILIILYNWYLQFKKKEHSFQMW